jgi:hypothetical protein
MASDQTLLWLLDELVFAPGPGGLGQLEASRANSATVAASRDLDSWYCGWVVARPR